MRKVVFALVVVALLAAACSGGGSAPTTGGNAANGEKLFKQTVIGALPGCVTCHSVDGSKLVGPSLQGIAARAGSTVSGMTAEAYLKQSILEPNAHVVKDYPQGVMQAYGKDLKEAEVADIVAYLLTLK